MHNNINRQISNSNNTIITVNIDTTQKEKQIKGKYFLSGLLVIVIVSCNSLGQPVVVIIYTSINSGMLIASTGGRRWLVTQYVGSVNDPTTFFYCMYIHSRLPVNHCKHNLSRV